jgi:hypothetical protein
MRDSIVISLANALLYARNPVAIARYIQWVKRLPNVACPRRYSERMLWRKLVDRNPLFIIFTDKLAAKEYCQRMCPDLAIPRTLWVGEDADAIPDDLLRGDVFVKTNHGYKFNYCIRNGKVDRADLKKKTSRWLAVTHGIWSAQWAYAQVPPKLFVEEAVGDARGGMIEFNIRASNGRPILGSVIGHNKLKNQWTVYLDLDGKPTAGTKHRDGDPIPRLPEGLDIGEPYRMALDYTRRLSVGVDYARFDFLWNGATLYGGEVTVYPAAGMEEIANPGVHATLVGGWDLAASHFLRTSHAGPRRIYAGALRRLVARQGGGL